ncbi:B-cadherin-like [Hypanus sabinus]|uniref:B-cadherin-like n=1 Tax=Hypanus sabinus TaxID=79690 RepID=UPI0028C3B529|nr:B-cadherin-like [Hypanus sabinus]
MSNFIFSCLGIFAFLLQVCGGEGSQRCEGFGKDSYVFEVASLAVGQVLGRVHFNCSEQNGLEFQTDNPSFDVESDGRVLVSDIPPTNQTSFTIVAFNKAEDTWKTAVTVLINGVKVQGSAGDKSDVPVFMFPSRFSHSALRRRKRDWVIPVTKHPENQRGPFPKDLVQIKSDRQRETKVYYSIKGPGADQPPIGVFTINKNDGKIVVHKPLDREERDKYRLTAHALDENGVEVEEAVEVVIEVIDMNDNRPQFILPTFYGKVVEGARPGTAFMNVTATDADEEDNANSIIKYSIESQNPVTPDSQMFTISSTSGLISVLRPGLDRETVDKYTLIVRAADMEGEGMLTSATVIITVVDANDNAPQFETPSVTVEAPENEVDYDVSRHSVTDADLIYTPAWKANFSITFGNERKQFTIFTDPQNNGVLRIVKPLDFEKNKQHVVIIEVKNEIPFVDTMPLSSATVTINVLDVNEAPIFHPETKKEKQPENLPVGSTVTTCKAKDPDTAQEQTVSYRMGSDPAHWFEIEPETGIVKLINPMDRESEFVKDSIYTAMVLASDNGSPPATGTGTILLQLEDINDNPPIATSLLKRVCNEDPVPVNVTIVDKDIPPNTSPFVVTLVHGANRNWTIESTENPHVKLLKLRNKIEPNTYEVPLRITDSGTPQLSQVTGLQVEVCDCDNGACSQRIAGAAFGFPGILAILGAILALLILVLLLLLFIRKKRSVKKEPLLPEEDIRDNVYHYDEEGGGEEDQDYDLSQLHRGLDARPEVVRNDVAPVLLAPQYRPRPANPDEIGNFIDENLKTADNDPTAPPYDSLLVFDYEGGGSEAESLSSVNSSNNSDADQDYNHLNDWGPRFRKLAEMYGDGED